MNLARPYLSAILIVLVALLCGCIAEDFPDLNDRALSQDTEVDGSAGDSGVDADDADDAETIECEDQSDCTAEANANQTGVCQSSTNTCRFPCKAGYADCDQDRSNGCEVNTNTDANNCGECQKVCPVNVTKYMPICTEGSCDIDSSQCVDGWKDLDEEPGCECEITDTNTCDSAGD